MKIFGTNTNKKINNLDDPPSEKSSPTPANFTDHIVYHRGYKRRSVAAPKQQAKRSRIN